MQGPGNEFPQQPQPGQPWQAPPGGPAPIPPPTGAPSGYNPGGQSRLNFDVIGEGWRAFQQNMGVWIPTTLIFFVIIYGISFGLGLALGATNPRIEPGQVPSSSFFAGMMGKQLVINLISLVVNSFLMGGMYRMATRQLAGRSIAIGDLFSATDVLPHLILAAILTGIATMIGALACGIGALFVSGLLILTTPLIVDRRMSATDAMSASWNALKGEWLMAGVFVLVIGLVAAVGAVLCGVGLLATVPTALIAVAATYRNYFGIEAR